MGAGVVNVFPVPVGLQTADPGGIRRNDGFGAARGFDTEFSTSVSQPAPLSPQDLTCKVCAPVLETTSVSIVVPLIIVEEVLLSIENPMETTG